MMHTIAAGIDEGEAVVPRIEVKEISPEWPQDVIAQAEAEDVRIERYDLIEPRGGQDRMPHAERPGAKPQNRTARPERLGGKLGAAEDLEPIADRIGEDDEIANPPLLRQRARAARDNDPALF